MSGKRRTRRERRLHRLLELAATLPEIEVTGEQHRSFRIRRKNFAYYLNDHHGDGFVSICCKASFDEQATLVELDPESDYVPAYLGSKGWGALRLDGARVD